MKTFTCVARYIVVFCLLLLFSLSSYAQRIYANNQDSGATGLLCLGCTVTNPANAADGNVETFSTINVSIGLAASTYQELIFPGTGKVAANTPVTVKLGTGNNLVSATVLGGITLQAYNGTTAIGSPVATSTLISALSSNNQFEVSITPSQTYDRIRVTLNGGVLGALSSIYLYEGFYNGSAAGACNSAVDELNGVSSGLLGLGASLGGVQNPQNAYDGNLTTASTLNAGVGLVGATAQETIIYEAPSVQGDSIRLTMSVPQSLLSAGVLSNISVTTSNGIGGTAETYSLSSSLLNVQLLGIIGGVQNITITYAPVNIFDRVQVTLGGGIANVLSTLNLYEAQKLIPRPVIKFNNVVTNNASICNGSTATLTAVAQPNTTFLWYSQATGGTPITTAGSFTTPALTATTTYYVAAMRSGCTDQSERTPVTVTVNQTPANPVVTNATVTVCPGQPATFAAQPVTGVTINWYAAATGGTPLATGNTFTTSALTQTTSYYAEAVAGGTCVSPTRTLVTATVSALPAAASVTPANATICAGNVSVLSINAPVAGVTYNWYATSTGGTPLYTGVNFTTPVLNTTTSYYVEAVNVSGCSSSTRTQSTVTVVPIPADPTLAANNLTISAGQTATINVTNSQTGTTYNWYTSTTAGTPIFTGATFTTPALYTNTTYYVDAVNGTGCQSADRTPITITVTINTNTPCSFANNQVSTVNGLCVGCTITNNTLSVDADTTTATTITVLAGLVGASASQQLLFQQPGFAGDTVKIEVGNTANLLDAAVASNIQVALYNGATLVESYPLTSNLIQISLLGGGSRYAIYVPATGAYDRAQITINSGIASVLTSLQIYYALQEYPKPVFNPASPEICSGSTAQINITSPTNGTFQWYTAPVGGTLANTGSSFTTPALTANTSYYVAYTRGTCVSTVRYPVQVLVDTPPAAPVVTPPTTTVYSGQTATFTATVPNNVTVNWYTAASGGTSVFTGTTFTTPALTTPTTYYAESSLGSCISTTRTPGAVLVQPNVVPDVTVTPSAQTINSGFTATLVASSTTPGTVFNWYTTPTGGTSIYTGATFTTPPLFAQTTYYAEAVVTASNTVSAARASGTVNISSSAVSPTPCDAAIAETTDINGLICLLCSVNNETGSVDADRNTFSQLDVPVGLLNAYAQQTLRFANTGMAGDTVVVELGVPGSLASVGVLSSISLATYNGSTYNNDMFNINTSLVSVTLLNGTTLFTYKFVATQSFDRVQIRLNSAVAGVLSALNIYDAYEEVPAPVISAPSVTTCQGTQTTLTATAPSYVTVRWYSTPTGGTPLFTGNVFNTPVLNATTTYYAEASRTADGCTQTVRTPATVTVTPIPSVPVVSAPTQTVCSGSSATFNAQAVNGVTFNWYTTATGGTPVFTGNPFSTLALTTSATYYVEADGSGTCGSSTRTLVTANVITTPTVPVIAQTPVQICSGSSAVLTATSAQPGVDLNWYTTPTGGTPIFTGAQYTTPALTANTSYYVEAATGTCISATRAEADVIVNPTPANPVVTITPAGGQITSGQTATLNATSGTAGVTFNWYTTATGGTPIFTGATFVTPALSSNTTYYVEAQLPSTGCTSAQRTAATITVNPIFSTSCDFASSQTNSNSGVLCVLCGVTNPNNAVDADTTTYSELDLPVALLGAYQSQNLIFSDPGIAGDTVTIRLRIPAALLSATVLGNIQITSYNGATANSDAVTLNSSTVRIQVLSSSNDVLVKFVPNAVYNAVQVSLVANVVGVLNTLDVYYATKQVEQPIVAISTVNICSGSTATFTVSNPRTGVTYNWYDSTNTLVATGTTFTTGPLAITSTFYVQSSRTSSGCANPNRVAVTANVTPSPVNPILAQSTVQICAGDNVTLSVTNAAGYTVQWYDATTGGNLLFTGANYQVSPVANATYYADLTNGSCTSPSRTLATVNVNQRPSQPGVLSNNVTVCANSPATITVSSPEAGVTYNYYTTPTGGTIAGSGTSFTTPPIATNTVYYVEAANTVTGCINNGGRTAVNIIVSDQVNAPTLSATTTPVCSGGSFSISVENPVAGLTYNWYDAATGGTLIFTGTTFTANNVVTNANYFVEAVNSNGCTSTSRTQTSVTVIPIPASPLVQTSTGTTSVCSGGSATINIVNPLANDVYNWYDSATGGVLLYTGTVFTTPALTSATTYYVEAATAGNCNPSARTAVTINVNALPTDPVLIANTQAVCLGSSATFVISSPQAGVSYKWYDSPSETNLLFTGTIFISGAITNTTNFYVSADNASGCSSNNLAQAQVTVQAAPLAPILTTSGSITACSGTQTTISIANPQVGYTYNWYTVPTGGIALVTNSSFTTPVLSTDLTYYVEADNSSGCPSAVRTPVTITVSTTPAAPVIGAGGTSACSGNTTTLTATSSDPTASINWYASAAGGTSLGTGNSFTTPVLNSNITYYAEADNSSGCPSVSRTPVNVTVTTTPAAPVVGTGGTLVCSGNATTLSITNPQAGLTYNWYNVATGGAVMATGTTFTTPVLNGNTIYYAEADNSSGCPSATRTAVNVTVSNTPAAPQIGTSGTTACAGNPTTLTATSSDPNTTIEWYTTPSGGAAVASGNSFTTPALTINTTYYAEADNTSGCSSVTRVAVNVIVSPIPAAPALTNVGTIQTCSGTQATLSIANPQAGYIYNWYTSASGGASVFTGTSFLTPALTGNISYYAEADNSNGCPSATRTEADIAVSTSPVAPQINASGTSICTGNTTTLTATNSDPNIVIKWYADATGTVVLATGNSFTTPILTGNVTYYADATNLTSGCISPTRTAVAVNVSALPTDPILINNSVAVCDGGNATLTISSPQAGVSYKWYDSPAETNLLFTGTTYITGPITATTNFYVTGVNGSGCNSNNLAQAQVTVQPAPAAPALTNASLIQTCSGTQVTLSIANPQAGYTYNWYTSATGGASIYTGISFTTPVLTSGTTYYAEASNSSGCPSVTRTAVSISIITAPSAPLVNAPGGGICPGSTITLGATSTDPSATIEWYTSATGGSPIATGGSFTTPALATNTTYYVGASNTTSGCVSTTRTPVTVNILQPLAAPVVAVSATTISSVTFEWGAVAGATGYQVSLDNGLTFFDPGSGGGGLTYTVSGLSPGQSVTLIVRAFGNSNCELSSNSAAVTGTAQNPFGDGIYVPNAFTPNGDGTNDIEYVYGNTIKSLTFYVYNQWGQMIFKSTSKTSGWDGTYKGTLQPVGVYVYYVEAVMNDGHQLMKKGTITLLR
jgi:gliding motility-associated-like protein